MGPGEDRTRDPPYLQADTYLQSVTLQTVLYCQVLLKHGPLDINRVSYVIIHFFTMCNYARHANIDSNYF